MSVALIADSHLGGPGGSSGPLVKQLLELPERGCRHLVLLGDIFQVWMGSPRWETPEIREVVPALRRLRQAGLRIDYVEGNRDFFLQGSPYEELFDHLSTEVAFEHDGVRYLAVHGDGLNDRDRQYLFWRWISKSAPVRFVVLRLPTNLAHRAMHRTEAQLSRTNFKHKRSIPVKAIRRYGERRLAEGYDVLLLGHFHTELTIAVSDGEIRLLDSWFHSHRVEWLHA
jgi:UDP-2,3-diacylglucosamine hydrolase